MAGIIFGFGFFTDTNPVYIIFSLFIPFTLAMQMFSFFLSTLAPSLKAANAVSYGIVLYAIVVESFVSDNNLLKFLFSSDVTSLIVFLKTFLLFYPPFSYTKVISSIIFRFSLIWLIMLGITSAFKKEFGNEEKKIMIGVFIRKQQEVLCHLGLEHLKDIQIFNQQLFFCVTVYFIFFLLGISIFWSLQIEVVDNLYFSPWRDFIDYLWKNLNRKKLSTQ